MAQASIASVRGLVQVLQSIRSHQKLPCAVTFEPDTGLSLRFLDGGHAMQSGISLSISVSVGGAARWLTLKLNACFILAVHTTCLRCFLASKPPPASPFSCP